MRILSGRGIRWLLFTFVLVASCRNASKPEPTPRTGANDSPTPSAIASSPPSSDLFASRPFVVGLPQNYDPSKALPLIVYLHGLGASGRNLLQHLHVQVLADEKRFLYVAPEGTVDSKGRKFWNATEACCNFDGRKVDDVEYISAIVGDVQRRYRLDPKRVFIIGYSNGGFMAHRLACERSERFAAIVSLAGAGYADSTACKPSEAVAVLQIHGDGDDIVPYAGGRVLRRRNSRPHPGARETVERWAARNRCASVPRSAGLIDLDDRLPGAESKITRHENCAGGAAELWTIPDAGHFIAQRRIAAEAMLDFLFRHPKP